MVILREIRFYISGVAVPKSRARTFPVLDDQGRVVVVNGKPLIKSRTPAKTLAWESYMAAIARQQAVIHKIKEPHDGPVALGMKFCHPIPKSWSESKKKRARNGLISPTSEMDLSNAIKSVEDAFEGIFYKNDSLIVAYVPISPLWKVYSDQPRIDILVQFLSLT